MKAIAKNLWVGSQADFEQLDAFGTEWAIVHACKDPHHRQFVGYKTAAAPEGPHRLLMRKGKRLALNLIDAADPKYVTKSMVDTAMTFIDEQLGQLSDPDQCLIHCNKGNSRGPTLGMLYLAPTLPEDFEQAEAKYREIYPEYAPGDGMRGFARIHWDAYRNRKGSWLAATLDRIFAETPEPESQWALDKARELYSAFCDDLKSDPNLARDRLIQGICSALLAAGTKAEPALEPSPNVNDRREC